MPFAMILVFSPRPNSPMTPSFSTTSCGGGGQRGGRSGGGVRRCCRLAHAGHGQPEVAPRPAAHGPMRLGTAGAPTFTAWLYVSGTVEVCLVVFTTRMELEQVSAGARG